MTRVNLKYIDICMSLERVFVKIRMSKLTKSLFLDCFRGHKEKILIDSWNFKVFTLISGLFLLKGILAMFYLKFE